jgi:nucleoside-diphosphate-sugar epimerase
MKNVIIAGATGMVGGLVLQNCLNNPDINTVTIIVRRPTGIVNEKLTEVVHNDFTNYISIEEHFKNQDIVYFCIGVYTGAVPRKRISYNHC